MRKELLKITLTIATISAPSLALSQNFYLENKDKPNHILNFQKPQKCEFSDRRKLIEHLRSLGNGNIINPEIWAKLSSDEKEIIVQDIVLATTPHENRKKFKPDQAGCEQYGLVPLSIASAVAKGQRIPPLKNLFMFQEYVNKISSMRICSQLNILYQDAPYRSFFYSKTDFSQIVGFLQNAMELYFKDPDGYSRKAKETRLSCPNEPESAQAVPRLAPKLDSSMSCSSHTDGDTLLFDKSYLISLMSYISENRDPFGGVVFGCWPGWQ
ncbi:MAG: hypothetical protein WCI18_15140 [Pseudomonadota bacterium]